MLLLVGSSGKRKICDIPVFPLTSFTVHRNRLLAQLFLDPLELKVSFTMRFMVDFGCSRQSREIHFIFI